KRVVRIFLVVTARMDRRCSCRRVYWKHEEMVFIPTVPLAPGITREFLLHHRVCPVRFDATGSLEVAVEDESVLDGLDDLAIAYEVSLVPNLVGAEQVRLLIERLTTGENHDVEYQVGAD